MNKTRNFYCFSLSTPFRLKQMEEEFYKFVTPAEIAKDLNLPKELATKIHKYWALKRKVLLLSKVYFFLLGVV